MLPTDIKTLNYEQRKKYRAAIISGYFDYYDEDRRAWKRTFCGAYVWKHPGRVSAINMLREVCGHLPTWEDLTDDNLKDFVDELSENLAPSSVKTICSELKAILNANYRHIPCDRNDFTKILSVKGTISQSIYLTRAEMKKIIDFRAVTNVERFVHRTFVVSLLTGARRCDAERMTVSNCDINTGMLSYVPKKTPNIIVKVPVDERFHLRRFLADDYHRECCNDVFNDCIRSICKRCNIKTEVTVVKANKRMQGEKWRFVSSHTARRSFATNLYLSGASLEDIALMMGHGKNIETTKRYICGEREISSNIMAYFQPNDIAI